MSTSNASLGRRILAFGIDYLAISGSLEARVTEYVDHLHEHFEDPCVVSNGHYAIPTAAGYSAKMRDASVARYDFPRGDYWSGVASASAP